MQADMPRALRLSMPLVVGLLAIGSAGCQSSGVGDPCRPEQIPEGGFNPGESYLETSSVQCRTRVCMVFNLDGDPSNFFDPDNPDDSTCDPATDETCLLASEIEQRVFCTCRCRAPQGSNTPTCSCPSGFACQDILQTGGVGVQGGYCVREDVVDSDAGT